MMRRTTKTALAAALLCGGLVPAAGASTLKIQLRADIRSINPGVNRDANTFAFLVAAGVYLVVNFVITLIFKKLEQKYNF